MVLLTASAEPREPHGGPARVSVVSIPSRRLSLEGFYEASYARLLSSLLAVSLNRQEAEDALQEAYIRLLPRWERIAKYEDPEAWVRRVALHVLITRYRRRRVATLALPMLAPRESQDAPSPDRLDVEAALRRLPLPHRAVLVLHHGFGMDLAQIAEQLDVPVGTVKSRLSRARSAFAGVYDNKEKAYG